MTASEKFAQPLQVSKVDLAFPTCVEKHLPVYDEIPDEFKRSSNKWNALACTWFYQGLPNRSFVMKDGVDGQTAFNHLQYCLGSWEPKHERKIAGVAYLMSLWFEDVIVE